MDLSLRRSQIHWGKEFPPDLNIDNHPDLPPSKGPENKQDNVEFKNSCFSNMIWRTANESNDEANIEKTNPESSDGDSFLNPNANEFVPEIHSNGNKDTSCELYEDKEIIHSGKDIVNDDDVITQEQLITSESNDSYNEEEISVITKSNDETMILDDNECASQTNTIYEVPDLDKQNTEINPSDAGEEENNVNEEEEETDTTLHNQLVGAESINDCDVSEIKESNDNEEQDDLSSHKSQVDQTNIETGPDSDSSRNFKENEELADERQDLNLESKCISPDQVESEYQSHETQAQVESEIPESDDANNAQVESEIPKPTNDSKAQGESDDLESNDVYQAESGVPELNTVEEAQLAPKIEEPYNDCESLAESEFSETVIASKGQVDSEIQESYDDSQVNREEIVDSNIICETQEESEIQEPYNATQLQEESELLDASIASEAQIGSEIQEATQLQEESEILDASIASEAQVESEIQESYNATQFREELEIQESNNAIQLQEESEVQESEVHDSFSPSQLQEETEIQEPYNATQLQGKSEIQEPLCDTPSQEATEIQESHNASPLQAESEIEDSNVVNRALDESEQSELSKLSPYRSGETELLKSSGSNDHDVTEVQNLSFEKKSSLDESQSVQDHLGNNKISNDEVETSSHQDVDKENTAVPPEQTTTKKNKKRRNKKKNKVNNQLNSGLDFDELVKDKTNYSENQFDNDKSTSESAPLHSSRSTSHLLTETKHSSNQSFREQKSKLTSKSSEMNEENSKESDVKNNEKTNELTDSKSINESIQNSIVDDENNVIKFQDEHFDINEVDKFIEEEQKAMAEFPNEVDIENQMKIEEELTDIVLSKQNEELKENISNKVKEEKNNQNEDVLCEKEDSALIKDDAASAGSSDQESSFEIINENAVRDDVVDINKLSQDLINDDGDLHENEIKNKSKVLSSTDTISSDISSIPHEENIENHTYDISVPKELDINKNETVLRTDALEQNDGAHIAGIDIKTENDGITMQEDHFSNKPTETIAEKLSSETFDAPKTKDMHDDGEIAEKVETGFNNVESNEINKEIENSEILNNDVVTAESINNENKEACFITERPPVLPHDAVNDEKIVAFVTQIEKPGIVMNGGESVSELPGQLEITNLESKIPDIVITREIQDEPVTKEDIVTAESVIVEDLVKSKICSGLETVKIHKISEVSTKLIDATKNEETSIINVRSKTEDKSDHAASDTEFESKPIDDFTTSDEFGDDKMLTEMINKFPNRVMPTIISENDIESAAIQELSTIAEITERTVSELPEDYTGQIVRAESDVEKSEKIIETTTSQEQEGVSNDFEKSLIKETGSSNSSQEGLLSETPTDDQPAKNKMTVSAFIKPKALDVKTSSKSAPKATPKTSSKPTTTTTSKPAAGATKLPPTSAAKPVAGTAKLAATGTTKTAKPSAAAAKLATTGTAKPSSGTVKSSTGSAKPAAAASKSAAPGSPKPTSTKTAVGPAVKVGSKTGSPTKPTVTTIKIAIKAAPKVASTKPTTPPGKTVAALKPNTPPLKISLTTKPSSPPSKPSTPKLAKIPSRPSTATKPLTPTSKANLAAAISLPAKPDSSTSATSTTVKEPSTPTSKSVEKSSSKPPSASSKPSSATRPSSASSKTPQPIKKLTTTSSKPAAVLKSASETPTKTVVKNSTETNKPVVKKLSDPSKSTLKTTSTSSTTKPSTTDKSSKTPSSPKTTSKTTTASTVKKSTTAVKDKKTKPPTKTDDKNVKKSIKTSSNKVQKNNEMNSTLNEVSSTTDYISSDTGLSQLSELPPQIIV